MTTGELRQYTDAVGGNWSPIVLNEGKTNRIAFVSYFKNEYSIRTLERKEPLHTAATVGLRRARADHRLPGAAAAHAGRRQPAQEGTLREDVPRRAAAGERRRHQQRRHLRRHPGELRRRARRQAGELLRRLDLAVPHAVAVLRRPVAPLPVGAAGLLADAVLLRPERRLLLRSVDRAAPQPRRCDRDADGARRQRDRHLSVQPLSPRRALGRPDPARRGIQRSDAAGSSRRPTSRRCTASRCCATAR